MESKVCTGAFFAMRQRSRQRERVSRKKFTRVSLGKPVFGSWIRKGGISSLVCLSDLTPFFLSLPLDPKRSHPEPNRERREEGKGQVKSLSLSFSSLSGKIAFPSPSTFSSGKGGEKKKLPSFAPKIDVFLKATMSIKIQ